VPQLILPLAASLSAPEERGGGRNNYEWILGILLSRTLSGFIGDTFCCVLCFGLPQDYVSYYFYHQETISL
jgi:hypothetical protein